MAEQTNPRTLILFSCWFPDERENSAQWAEYYAGLLSSQLAGYDKIVCLNHGCPAVFGAMMAGLPGVLVCDRVPAAMHVNSDAAGYQLALRHAQTMLAQYQSVLFLQSKGVTKGFVHFDGFRWLFGNKLLNPAALDAIGAIERETLAAVFCHPPTFGTDVAAFSSLVGDIAPGRNAFMCNATYTVFAASAPLVARALAALGSSFFSENIDRRFDRFYFELIFPSLLLTLGGDLHLLEEAHYNPLLHASLSYNYDLPHSSALVLDLFRRYQADSAYRQHPVPMMFGTMDELKGLTVNFAV